MELQVRIRLKHKETGKIIWMSNKIFDPQNGLAFFSIKREHYELLSVDRFTGRKDMLEREIYENDIVQTEGMDDSVITWNDEDCGFVRYPSGQSVNYYLDKTAVVGNIHEDSCI